MDTGDELVREGDQTTGLMRREGTQAKLNQFSGRIWPRSRPVADLATAAGDAFSQPPGQHVPAEITMVGRRARQGLWVASQDLSADRRQPFAKYLAHVGVSPRPPHDGGDFIVIDVADGQLVEVGSEAAAWLDFTSRV